MGNLSSKQVQDIQSLYEGIYQDNQETISEEDFCDILAIEICNALIKEGLLEGEVITETSLVEGRVMTALKTAGKVLRQVTGVGTKPTTTAGQVVRGAQQLGTGAAIFNPDVRDRLLRAGTAAVVEPVKQLFTPSKPSPSLGQRVSAFIDPNKPSQTGKPAPIR